MKIAIFKIDKGRVDHEALFVGLEKAGVARDSVVFLDSNSEINKDLVIDFVFFVSSFIQYSVNRYSRQIEYMNARERSDAASFDVFVDIRKKEQGKFEVFSTVVMRWTPFLKFFKTYDENREFNFLNDYKVAHWDLPLGVLRRKLEQNKSTETLSVSPAYFVSRSKIDFLIQVIKTYFIRPEKNDDRLCQISKWILHLYHKTKSDTIYDQQQLSRIKHLVFLPFPGNGGADYSNIVIFKNKQMEPNRSFCFFTGHNLELTEKQAIDYESQFFDHLYLSGKVLPYFEPYYAVTKILNAGNIQSVFVYASEFGARICHYIKDRNLPIKTHVILHNRLISGWLGHAIRNREAWDEYIVINEQIKMHLEEYGVSASKVCVEYLDKIWIPHLGLSAVEKKKPDVSDHLLLGFVGRLSKEKGVYRLLALAKECRDIGLPVKFSVIGSGSESDAFLAKMGEWGLSDFFVIKGYLKDPLPEYKKMDGLLSLSDIEGIPLVLMEAVALNVPVFSTPAGEIADFKYLRLFNDGQIEVTATFDVDEFTKQFIAWCSRLLVSKSRKCLDRVVFLRNSSHEVEIPYILSLIHKVRGTGFANEMELSNPRKRALFLYWWIAFGFPEYHFAESFISQTNNAALWAKINGPVDGLLHWSLFADVAYEFNQYLNDAAVPRPALGSEIVLKWFYAYLVPTRKIIWFIPQNVVEYLRQSISYSDLSGDTLDRLMVFVHSVYPQCSNQFELNSVEGRAEFKKWYIAEGVSQFHLNGYYLEDFSNRAEVEDLAVNQLFVSEGVNIVGLSGSVSGVGEDARMMAAALGSAGINYEMVSYSDRTQYINCKYNTNVFCLTGFQIILSLAIHGERLFKGRYNIGYFPWELPEWPKELIPALDLCDELWVSTKFIYDSIRPFTSRPVRIMPMAVALPPESATLPVRLSSNEVVFIFIYDFISGSERKNIWACIAAFKTAFSTDEKVKLIIKTMNHAPEMDDYKYLKEIISNDSRIIHIEDKLTRIELISLLNDSDVFLSLHRAEGFGRAIAESMLLRKHIVTTEYSGNVDFCNTDNSFLVSYDLVPVRANEYVFSQNQVWAQVHMDDAVDKIRSCYKSILEGRRSNDQGREFILEHHAPQVVGANYRRRLSEVGCLT